MLRLRHEYCVLLNPYRKTKKEKQELVRVVSSTWEETLKKPQNTTNQTNQPKKPHTTKNTEITVLLRGDSSEGTDVYKAVLGKQVGNDLSPNSRNKLTYTHWKHQIIHL